MAPAVLLDDPGGEIAEEREHLGHRVADRRAGRENDAVAAVQLRDPARLDVQIHSTLRLGGLQPLDVPHPADRVQVLVAVRLVHEEHVHAQLLEGDRRVLSLRAQELEELGFEPGERHLDLTHHPGLLALRQRQLDQDALVIVDHLADEGGLRLGAHRQQAEGAVGHDDGVPGACGDARHECLALALAEVALTRNEEIGGGVHLVEVVGDLLDHRVRHDHHGLLGEAEALGLHDGTDHLVGLAVADAMGQERILALEDAPDRVHLVRVERHGGRHPGHLEVGAVEGPQAHAIEPLVVVLGDRCGAVGVLPDPRLEAIHDRSLLVPGRLGRADIQDATAVRHLVVDHRRLEVQRHLHELDAVDALRAPLARGLVAAVGRPAVHLDAPVVHRSGVAHGHAGLTHAEDRADELRHGVLLDP